MFVQDFIANGQGFGPVGESLSQVRYETALMRPFIDDRGRNCVLVNAGAERDKKTGLMRRKYEKRTVAEVFNERGIMVNGPTSLRKDEWKKLDNIVLTAARQRLRAWRDLASRSSFSGFDGMGKMILEHETMSDTGEAMVDMDTLTEGRNFAPKFQLEGLPLPITHADFWLSSRRLAISRNSGTPLDSTLAEMAGRKVAEKVEKTLIGVETGLTYGDTSLYGRAPTVYGYLNFPDRILKTDLTAPTAVGWTPATLVNEIIEMRQLLYDIQFYGPFMLYHSPDWAPYLDQDYNANYGGVTLRQRIMGGNGTSGVTGISAMEQLDYLPSATHPWTLLLVQMTAEVARAVEGMGITTVQWESQGGARINFKVLTIMVPQLRADYNGNTGIVHATTS